VIKILIIPIAHLSKLIDTGIWEAIGGVLLRMQIERRLLYTRESHMQMSGFLAAIMGM
jgi:hypothetical protein